MTYKTNRAKRERLSSPLIPMPLLAEFRKMRASASITVSGIVSITELSDIEVSLATHAGRVTIRGESLSLVIFEAGVVTVNGKIVEVSFGYAKN